MKSRIAHLHKSQSGINMVDLMMWLVIAALLLASAVQGIFYYQQAAYAYQAKSDVAGGMQWAGASNAIESEVPTIDKMEVALSEGDYDISNDEDIALLASEGKKYCLGVKAFHVVEKNVFYAYSDNPSRILRGDAMPVDCGTPSEVAGPKAPPSDSDGDGTPNSEDEDIDNDGIPNSSDPDIDGDGTPNETDPDIDGDRIKNEDDTTPNGATNDPDTDGDGIPDSTDTDIDGDGTPNSSDPDIDGDGVLNEGDDTPYGNGSSSQPSLDAKMIPAASAGRIDPRVEITDMTLIGPDMSVKFGIDLAGVPTNTSVYWGISYRIVCELQDGSQFYKHGWMWTSYDGGSNPTPTHTFSCPASGSQTANAVDYVVGADGAHPALTSSSGQPGPKNVAIKGDPNMLRGHDSTTLATSGYINERVSIRKVKQSGNGVSIGLALNLGGLGSSTSSYYGLSTRLTCELSDGSQFYRHIAPYFTSFQANTYPAPSYLAECPAGSSYRGYVAGPDNGSPELTDTSGQRGPKNIARGGATVLTGNVETTLAPSGSYVDPRLTVRSVTFDGTAAAKFGINIDTSGLSGTMGYNWGFSYRLTCESSTGSISYKTSWLTTSYTASSNQAPSYSLSCSSGTAVGAVIGAYRAHPALTSSSGQKAPIDYAVVGKQ